MPDQVSALAGKPLPRSELIDVPRLITAYFTLAPDPLVASQRISFGTSGHRGSAFTATFNEAHVRALTQSVCRFRRNAGIDGPLFLGKDTHALSQPAFVTAIEVLAANGVETMVDAQDGYTPTPVISHAILRHNHGRKTGLADGIVLSPSHNPPDEGGFKYNPPHGGPAGKDVTGWIEAAANQLLAGKLREVARIPYERARKAPCVHPRDYIGPYISDLENVVDLDLIREAGVRIGIDPLGGAAIGYWQPLIERCGIAATVVNDIVDPAFGFMTADWDGKVRMDCSSPYAMKRLIALEDKFDVAFANDTDADRHGIVCPTGGLMKPNEFLVAAISHLFANRPRWRDASAIGKTVVSSSMVDRLAKKLGRDLFEAPVGFKWFSEGLLRGSLAFAGEESAGASFLRRDGSVWTTDKDGLIMGLLAAEMTARTGRDPKQIYESATSGLGRSYYERIDAPATPEQKAIIGKLDPAQVSIDELAGEAIEAKFVQAPGNDEPIGGLKVVTRNGWFAVRPSGTEDVYKIYAESLLGEGHLRQIQQNAQRVVQDVLGRCG